MSSGYRKEGNDSDLARGRFYSDLGTGHYPEFLFVSGDMEGNHEEK